MSTFIRTIGGRISAIDYGKKELSLIIKEDMGGRSVDKNISFSMDPNVTIMNTAVQQVKLSELLKGHYVEIGYTRHKSRRTASTIKRVK
jgi:hypothetical protein